ncbi:hypothetical protein ACQKD0_04885 [Vreelandella aquamarina]|uniref:hypothetical protein n=1 Tax=Vreelandella aquamarina TaxID=77097 RepID=UPI003CFC190E
MTEFKSPDENGWHIILISSHCPLELRKHTPPTAEVVLFWNRNRNCKHAENSYRIGGYLLENTTDCSHWMRYTEGMEMPPPPTDFSHFD